MLCAFKGNNLRRGRNADPYFKQLITAHRIVRGSADVSATGSSIHRTSELQEETFIFNVLFPESSRNKTLKMKVSSCNAEVRCILDPVAETSAEPREETFIF